MSYNCFTVGANAFSVLPTSSEFIDLSHDRKNVHLYDFVRCWILDHFEFSFHRWSSIVSIHNENSAFTSSAMGLLGSDFSLAWWRHMLWEGSAKIKCNASRITFWNPDWFLSIKIHDSLLWLKHTGLTRSSALRMQMILLVAIIGHCQPRGAQYCFCCPPNVNQSLRRFTGQTLKIHCNLQLCSSTPLRVCQLFKMPIVVSSASSSFSPALHVHI